MTPLESTAQAVLRAPRTAASRSTADPVRPTDVRPDPVRPTEREILRHRCRLAGLEWDECLRMYNASQD